MLEIYIELLKNWLPPPAGVFSYYSLTLLCCYAIAIAVRSYVLELRGGYGYGYFGRLVLQPQGRGTVVGGGWSVCISTCVGTRVEALSSC